MATMARQQMNVLNFSASPPPQAGRLWPPMNAAQLLQQQVQQRPLSPPLQQHGGGLIPQQQFQQFQLQFHAKMQAQMQAQQQQLSQMHGASRLSASPAPALSPLQPPVAVVAGSTVIFHPKATAQLQVSGGTALEEGHLLGEFVTRIVVPPQVPQQLRAGQPVMLIRAGDGGTLIRVETMPPTAQLVGTLPQNVTQVVVPLLSSGKACFAAAMCSLDSISIKTYLRHQYVCGIRPTSPHEKSAWESLAATLAATSAPAPITIVSEEQQTPVVAKRLLPHDMPGVPSGPPVKRLALDDDGGAEMDMMKSFLASLGGRTRMIEAEPARELLLGLRSYQKQALGWLIAREQTKEERKRNMKLPAPWKEYTTSGGKKYYFNPTTKETKWDFPISLPLPEEECSSKIVRGGLLCDDMGMGKTIEILALILTNKLPASAPQPIIPWDPDKKDDTGNVLPFVPCKSTLIVCPLSLLSQWADEIRTHTVPGTLSVYVYHGQNRVKDPLFMAKHDVIITTYHTLAAEQPNENSRRGSKARQILKEGSPLLQVPWFRVVLDEAHTIKERTTHTARAAFALSALSRWCVTGTPVQNKLDDMQSLLRFIRVEPLADYAWWNSTIMRPLKSGDFAGFDRLQTMLPNVLLRRTKDMKVNGVPILALPPRTVTLRRDSFTNEEDKFYQALWNKSQSKFNSFVQDGTALKNYAHILELLLRLRQACDHPILVTGSAATERMNRTEELASLVSGYLRDAALSDDGHHVPTAFAARLQAVLGPGWEDEECPVCMEVFEMPVITACGRVVCHACVEKALPSGQDKSVMSSTSPTPAVVSPPPAALSPDADFGTARVYPRRMFLRHQLIALNLSCFIGGKCGSSFQRR
eukprot:TRINITY_DN3757_c0_g1_i2.p1 TRINITY_DN3757_c0_g1~~TRINITY_DN3757_c0_g1_i2.p1  ORF type:complete len:965 (+),score=241.35 TRINITY_DN3757_c0_g1_i2:292-2895(+)